MVQVYVIRWLPCVLARIDLHSIMVQVYGKWYSKETESTSIYIPLWFKSMVVWYDSVWWENRFTFHYGSSLCVVDGSFRDFSPDLHSIMVQVYGLRQSLPTPWLKYLHSIMVQVYAAGTAEVGGFETFTFHYGSSLCGLGISQSKWHDNLHSIMVQVYVFSNTLCCFNQIIYIPLWFKSMWAEIAKWLNSSNLHSIMVQVYALTPCKSSLDVHDCSERCYNRCIYIPLWFKSMP